jgi:hypothetical protein
MNSQDVFWGSNRLSSHLYVIHTVFILGDFGYAPIYEDIKLVIWKHLLPHDHW